MSTNSQPPVLRRNTSRLPTAVPCRRSFAASKILGAPWPPRDRMPVVTAASTPDAPSGLPRAGSVVPASASEIRELDEVFVVEPAPALGRIRTPTGSPNQHPAGRARNEPRPARATAKPPPMAAGRRDLVGDRAPCRL